MNRKRKKPTRAQRELLQLTRAAHKRLDARPKKRGK